jgi:flavodoxin
MKTAVVYYSLNGNCAFVAEEIKTLLNADKIRLQTQDDKRRGGIAKFLWALGMVFKKKKPALKPYTFDSAAYDLIIIGAPVWADTPAPPIHTFISETGITGKKVAYFACNMGRKEKFPEKFRDLLSGNDIIGEADFISAAKNSEEAKRQIADWVKTITA